MKVRVTGLEFREGVWKYHRAIPPHLRSSLGGTSNIIRSLSTSDLNVAQRRT
jgi:hypothetical protein